MDNLNDEAEYKMETLESWVISNCNRWREHYNSNYEQKFEEY